MLVSVNSTLIFPHTGFACWGSTARRVSGRGFCASLRFLHLERSPFFGSATLRVQGYQPYAPAAFHSFIQYSV